MFRPTFVLSTQEFGSASPPCDSSLGIVCLQELGKAWRNTRVSTGPTSQGRSKVCPTIVQGAIFPAVPREKYGSGCQLEICCDGCTGAVMRRVPLSWMQTIRIYQITTTTKILAWCLAVLETNMCPPNWLHQWETDIPAHDKWYTGITDRPCSNIVCSFIHRFINQLGIWAPQWALWCMGPDRHAWTCQETATSPPLHMHPPSGRQERMQKAKKRRGRGRKFDFWQHDYRRVWSKMIQDNVISLHGPKDQADHQPVDDLLFLALTLKLRHISTHYHFGRESTIFPRSFADLVPMLPHLSCPAQRAFAVNKTEQH